MTVFKKIRWFVMSGVLSAVSFTMISAEESDVLFKYVFSDPEIADKLEMKSGAAITDGLDGKTLKLRGNGDFTIVKDSQKMNFPTEGATIIGVVKFNDNETTGGKDNAHDMIVSKGNEFIFGRDCDGIYFNFHDGSNWVATTKGGELPVSPQWTHVAAVIERVNDFAQGDVGYKVSIFVNGELEVKKKFLFIKPQNTDAKIEIGKGFGGGPWFMNGEIAELAMYKRAMTSAEVAKMAGECKLVKIIPKGQVELDNALKIKIGELNSTACSPSGKWAISALENAGRAGYDQKELLDVLEQTAFVLKNEKDTDSFVEKWNAQQSAFQILKTNSMLAMIAKHDGSRNYPLLAVMNRRNNAEIFGAKAGGWDISYLIPATPKASLIKNTNPEVKYKVSEIKNSGNSAETLFTWEHAESADNKLAFTAQSRLKIDGPRMTTDFRVTNKSDDIVISEVNFPSLQFKKLVGGNDTLVFPKMSGVLVRNPTEEEYAYGKQEGEFPSGSVSMQFAAYYDNAGGIYFGFEDPMARSKFFSANGKRKNIEVLWSSYVGLPVGKNGGNGFETSGKFAIELYDGDWFEAGQIYKRFLAAEAKWWIKDLPRESTPEWYRNLTLWILGTGASGKKKEEAEILKNNLVYLRQYFELPIAFQYERWYDDSKGGWPHFYPTDYNEAIFKELEKNGVRVRPYTDPRLWSVKDGPNFKSDWMFSSHGKKFAAKQRDGSMYYEDYNTGDSGYFAVMCPGAKGWQDWIVNLGERMRSYGVSAIYHDQVATGSSKPCFDPTHGHDLNGSDVWLEKGYWPMFEALREHLAKKYPDMAHDTEEAADPYLQAMDGYMCWRWTLPDQVPLFSSIYAGRVQFTGKLYNSDYPGDVASFYVKATNQLVNSEQIGWFTVNEIVDANFKRVFIKKLMHIRHGMLNYFNEADRMRPLTFKGDVPQILSKWGAAGGAKMINTEKIQHSVWKRSDGRIMMLFVNSVDEKISVTPVINLEKLGLMDKAKLAICREGSDKAEMKEVAGIFTMTVELSPFTAEIWLLSDKSATGFLGLFGDASYDGFIVDSERLASLMKKISTYDAGKSLVGYDVFKVRKQITAVPGKWITPADISDMHGCSVAKDNSHVGWINAGAMIYYGEVDVGSKDVKALEIEIAADPNYAAGTIEIIATAPGKEGASVASVEVKSTGGFDKFKRISVPLKPPLEKGKHDIIVKFSSNACCNFKQWRIIE